MTAVDSKWIIGEFEFTSFYISAVLVRPARFACLNSGGSSQLTATSCK